MSDNGTQLDSQQPANGKHAARVILGVLAAVLVAFCVWAMSVYVQGGDPLAWATGSAAFQTTAEEEQPADQDAAASQEASQTTTVTTDDVYSALASLQFDGTDVSLERDAAHVVLSADGIWVEEASSADAPDMALVCAQRSAALAAWVSEQDVGIPGVTWICEDGTGAVRMAITMPTAGAPTTGDLATLLSAATGYGISGDAYAQLGAGDISQFAGTAPTLPDGTAISIDANVTTAGENLSAADVATRQKDVSSGAAGVTSAGAPSGTGSTSSATGTQSGSSSAQSTQDAKVRVAVTIDARADGGSSSSYTVSLDAGATAYDALLATGASVNARSTAMGVYIAAINGYAEKDQGGESGWKYAVNGSYPSYSAGACKLSDGDAVTWVYATSA
ncbi:MAG: DUF4430 domain-containing protein [Olsenella sp.]|jgi:hypothetical protein|nr:DUF4430 domain-containing protein [Olsenella sp.]MCI1645845.1 DUF4430 domain-containing protein [Olsenella sp.]MCI1794216.1 DUF4430 domain-containing protein [Olsenella sp.]MCI1810777.1 DUF4430 domain-containing protein [Olsenella sp.]MCI1879726.1 DUF4430 domain-containing protein [Olsenella sp.]